MNPYLYGSAADTTLSVSNVACFCSFLLFSIAPFWWFAFDDFGPPLRSSCSSVGTRCDYETRLLKQLSPMNFFAFFRVIRIRIEFFRMNFYLEITGWISETGVCENSVLKKPPNNNPIGNVITEASSTAPLAYGHTLFDKKDGSASASRRSTFLCPPYRSDTCATSSCSTPLNFSALSRTSCCRRWTEWESIKSQNSMPQRKRTLIPTLI